MLIYFSKIFKIVFIIKNDNTKSSESHTYKSNIIYNIPACIFFFHQLAFFHYTITHTPTHTHTNTNTHNNNHSHGLASYSNLKATLDSYTHSQRHIGARTRSLNS